MILIAHRGNTFGPRTELENSPDYIMSAIRRLFNVEFDVWKIDNLFFLGHDKPTYEDKKTYSVSAAYLFFHETRDLFSKSECQDKINACTDGYYRSRCGCNR